MALSPWTHVLPQNEDSIDSQANTKKYVDSQTITMLTLQNWIYDQKTSESQGKREQGKIEASKYTWHVRIC